MYSAPWKTSIFYWTLEKLQSGTLGARVTWLSIDAVFWLLYITPYAKFIAGLSICISITSPEYLLECVILCHELGQILPGNRSIHVENQRNKINYCKKILGEILTHWSGEFCCWALMSWWYFCSLWTWQGPWILV